METYSKQNYGSLLRESYNNLKARRKATTRGREKRERERERDAAHEYIVTERESTASMNWLAKPKLEPPDPKWTKRIRK